MSAKRKPIAVASATALALFAVVNVALAQPSATIGGPSEVSQYTDEQWNCTIQYRAFASYPTTYTLFYYFTYEQVGFVKPSKVSESGPIPTSDYTLGTEPNFDYQAWISSGSTGVYMYPGQVQTQFQTSETYGYATGDAIVNCTTGADHQYDDNDYIVVQVNP